MTNLKQVKSELKAQKLMKQYNKKFKNKDMKFLFTFVALAYNDSIKLNFLVKEEKDLMNKKNDQSMFVSSYKKLNKYTNDEILWDEFGIFIWYIFQTSTYWKDKRKKKENIFKDGNFVKVNQEKRNHYNAWLQSIPADFEDQNEKLIKVLRKVF